MTSALEGGEGLASRPGRTLRPGKTPYSFYRRLGGPQGRPGQVRKISSPPGFDSQTVQSVGSRYSDYATRPTCLAVTLPILVTLYNTMGIDHLKFVASMYRVEATGSMLLRSSCSMGDNYQYFGKRCYRQFRGRQIVFLRKAVSHLYIPTVHSQADDNPDTIID